MRIALGVEYDGSAFCGWQKQRAPCSIQGILEGALSQIACERVSVVSAGRTDAGVHALGQVVHFDTQARRPLSAWVRGSNALLTGSVCVLWAHPVPDAFHARYSALSRCYRYVLLNHPVRPALQRGGLGWYHRKLDATVMHAAAQSLVGEHDYSAFRAAECQAKTPVRTLYRANVARRGDFVLFEFCANAFLQHMVRNIVGSLIAVGNGNRALPWMSELLRARNRTLAGATAAAAGLYLAAVQYADEWRLPPDGARDMISDDTLETGFE